MSGSAPASAVTGGQLALDRELAALAEQLAQRQHGADAVGLRRPQVGLRAAGLDLGAQALLLRDVAGALAPGRGGREVGRAAADVGDLQHALLRRREVPVGGGHGDLLLDHHLVEVRGGGVGRARGGAGAQLALVAPLQRPVDADRLVDALVAQHVAAADAVLQVDLARLGGEHGRRCMVGRRDVGARAIDGTARDRHLDGVARGLQGLRRR